MDAVKDYGGRAAEMMIQAGMKTVKKFVEDCGIYGDKESMTEKRRVQSAVAHLNRCWGPLQRDVSDPVLDEIAEFTYWDQKKVLEKLWKPGFEEELNLRSFREHEGGTSRYMECHSLHDQISDSDNESRRIESGV